MKTDKSEEKMQEFTDWFRMSLRKSEKSQADVARALKLDPSTVYYWSIGSRYPTKENFIKLQEYFSDCKMELLTIFVPEEPQETRTHTIKKISKEEAHKLFSQNFRRILRSKGIRQKDVCEALEFHRAKVSAWATGRACPTLNNIMSLSKFLNVSLDELTGGVCR